MKSINWKQGFRRLHYLIVSIIWIFMLWLVSVGYEPTFSDFAEAIGGLSLFTLCYCAFFMFVEWVIKGFMPSKNS